MTLRSMNPLSVTFPRRYRFPPPIIAAAAPPREGGSEKWDDSGRTATASPGTLDVVLTAQRSCDRMRRIGDTEIPHEPHDDPGSQARDDHPSGRRAKEVSAGRGDPLTVVDLGEGVFLSPKRSLLPKLAGKIEQLRRQHGVSLEELLEGVAEQRQRAGRGEPARPRARPCRG